jgi:hypothetical protein
MIQLNAGYNKLDKKSIKSNLNKKLVEREL